MLSFRYIHDEIIKLGEERNFQKNHALQVAWAALRLFDELQSIHNMGNTERMWLWLASVLHDVGKSENKHMHHKIARDAIIKLSKPPFRKNDRIIMGLVARYHRGALPERRHKYFKDLDEESRVYVKKLAAILRLADGLDKNCSTAVTELNCTITTQRIYLDVSVRAPLDPNIIVRKTDLFVDVFKRDLIIKMHKIGEPWGKGLDFDATLLQPERKLTT